VSRENTETVQLGLEAFNCRDAAALQALCTPDVELVPLPALQAEALTAVGLAE
jgi:hypothetical protein